MTDALPDACERVRRAAEKLGLTIAPIEMPASTHTAQQAADACGCTLAQIVKSLVFQGKSSKRPYLFLVSGPNRVDEAHMATLIGEGLKRMDARDVRDVTGFAIGGIPPLGHDARLKTFLDQDLMSFDVVWAAAGTPRSVFSASPHALAEATGARVVAMSAASP
jgi:prolyl-tRNA editing enzyme YbaK/EbsC (Cys-tRNA(Pro) deacylase)